MAALTNTISICCSHCSPLAWFDQHCFCWRRSKPRWRDVACQGRSNPRVPRWSRTSGKRTRPALSVPASANCTDYY